MSQKEINAETMSAGAVWMGFRPKSRSANRIVQRLEDDGNTIHYSATNVIGQSFMRSCSKAAWVSWIEREDARYCHISQEHIIESEQASSPTFR